MKTLTISLSAVVVFSLLTLASNAGFGQTTSTTTTITSNGTVSESTPDAIVVRENASAAPVRYTFTKTTTYVDENGNPVSVETVRTGVPVTVYYERNGDSFVADKIVVGKTITTTDATIPTTTTTTVTQPLPAPPAVNGIVTDVGPSHIDIRTHESLMPVHYRAHDSTAYVDESGNPVPKKILAAGTPVTIFYEQHDDSLWATRVVVRDSPIIEKQTTTTTTRQTTLP